MNRPVFNPLVALEQKPEVTGIPVVNIRFLEAKKVAEVEGEPLQAVRTGVKIVNKRRGPEYREEVLQRLAKNANLPFVRTSDAKQVIEISAIEEVVAVNNEPVKSVKRLIIKQPVAVVEQPVKELVEEPVKELVEEPVKELVEEVTEKPVEEPVEQPVKSL